MVSLEIRLCLTVVSVACALAACSSRDGTVDDGATTTIAVRDGGATTDASSSASFDAAALPAPLTSCNACLQTTCAPEVQACVSDAVCKGILECTATTGCLSSGAEACAKGCAASAGLTPRETARVTALLVAIASSCSSCLAACPLPTSADASRD